MSNAQHPRSRSKDLIRITRDYLEETGNSELGFSKVLWLNYLSMIPKSQQSLDISTWGGPFEKESDKIIDKQYTRFIRYMAGGVNLPADLEEAWVEALEEPYRSRAIQLLCGRYNVIAVDQTKIPDAKRASLCVAEFSEFLCQAGKMLEDGRIDHDDLQHLEALEAAGQRLVAQVSSLVCTAQVKTQPLEDKT